MATGAIRIRRARRADLAAIILMADALNRYEGKPPTGLTETVLDRHIFGPTAMLSCLIAELDRHAVGYATFQPTFDTESASAGLYLADLFVAESARRRGVGRALVRALADETLRRGYSWLSWQVMVTNPQAQAFYRAIGGSRIEVDTYAIDGDQLSALAGTLPPPQ